MFRSRPVYLRAGGIILIIGLTLVLANLDRFAAPVFGQDEYSLRLSTMEIVDRNSDGRKDGLEIFYILKRGGKNIELSQDVISGAEAYLYEDRNEEALMTFWQIGELKEVVFSESNIYLPLRSGFAYNIYMDRIVPAILKLKIVFREGGEIEVNLKDRLSFLSY